MPVDSPCTWVPAVARSDRRSYTRCITGATDSSSHGSLSSNPPMRLWASPTSSTLLRPSGANPSFTIAVPTSISCRSLALSATISA